MDYSEFIPAILGAVTGGGISLLTQDLSFRRQERLRKKLQKKSDILKREHEKKIQSQHAYIVLIKINRCCTEINLFNNLIKETISKTEARGGTLSQNFVPILADPSEINFTAEELLVIKEICSTKTIQNIIDLPYITNSHIASFSHLRKLKSDIACVPAIGKIDADGVATMSYEDQNAIRSKILLFEMDSVLNSIRTTIPKDRAHAFRVFKNTQDEFTSYFGKSELGIFWDIDRHLEQ
ncbi:hypothetical protein [uncultured Brevundimonas sp.]|uniref:hypothetical protein n=1 Tax=uncultured Brevundimonas sp. TaxID=213418 RepID=UPI002620B27F|nr:hypothetical protein [uncultured Brevundimonas sp.]